MSLLVLENIVKEYRNKLVLNGASLRVEKGERVALTGPNGSGKTTLLRIATGLESYDTGNTIIAKGTKLGYLTQDLNDLGSSEKIFKENALFHEEINRLEQKLRELEKKMEAPQPGSATEEYNMLVAEYSRVINRYESMDGYTIGSRIKSTLLGLGLRKEALTIPVGFLSGGEKMRVALARILLEQPDLLILDEPTNHLDISAVEWLEGFLKKFDGGVLFVSHDRYFLDQTATRVAELENGIIVERGGNYSTFIEQKQKMREFALREQFRLRQEIRKTTDTARELEGMKRVKAAKSRMKIVQRLQGELNGSLQKFKQDQHLFGASGPKLNFDGVKHVSAEIAGADNLHKSFGSIVLFSGADFLVCGGEKVGIIGPNGCGKTTLINILLGRDTDYTGYARLGQWVRYGYLGQEVTFEDENFTIIQQLLSLKEMTEYDAREYLAKFQFYGDETDKRIEVLSGGERVRLYLACMMLEKPDCLIMDEPTNHLDVSARDAVEKALQNFTGTIIAISHDRYFLNHCVNRILEIEDGNINSYEGNYDSYRQVKAVREIPKTDNREEKNRKYSPAITNSRTSKDNSINKGESNKKVDMVQLEARITLLEEKARLLENSFDKDTLHEVYMEYNMLLQEIDELFEVYASNDV